MLCIVSRIKEAVLPPGLEDPVLVPPTLQIPPLSSLLHGLSGPGSFARTGLPSKMLFSQVSSLRVQLKSPLPGDIFPDSPNPFHGDFPLHPMHLQHSLFLTARSIQLFSPSYADPIVMMGAVLGAGDTA